MLVVAAETARDHPWEVQLGTCHGQKLSCSPSRAHFPPDIDEGKSMAGGAVIAPKACMGM